MVALAELTAELDEPARLLGLLDPLGYGREVEHLCQVEDRAKDGRLSVGLADLVNEGLGDLEVVEGKLLEVAKRRMADAEVVDGDLDPERLELAEPPRGRVKVVHQSGLGDLQRQAPRVELRGAERIGNLVDDAIVAKLGG